MGIVPSFEMHRHTNAGEDVVHEGWSLSIYWLRFHLMLTIGREDR